MRKNITSILIIALLSLILGATAIYGAQDFSVSPSSLSETVNQSTAGGSSFTVTNTGNETISLSVTKTNPTGGAGTIILNLGTTTISNLAAGNSTTVAYTYTSGTNLGTSTGLINVENQANSSQEKNVSVSITTTAGGATLSIDNVGSTITINGDVGEEDDVRLKFRNNGNIDLTNIDLSIEDNFDGVDSSDEIEDNDFDFDDDARFDLDVDETENVDFIVDVPNDISADTYEGVLTVTTDQGTFTWLVEVIVDGGDDDIFIAENSEEVRDGVLEIVGEAGENVDNYKFLIVNDGNTDFSGITFQLDGDLEEEFTSNTIPESAVTFNPTDSNVDKDDDDDIEVEVEIPEGTASGSYFADLEIYDSTNDKLDEIILKVRVVGDVFISSIEYKDTVEPGDRLDVDITVENSGSTIFRDVKIEAILFDVDEGTEDLTESSSTFLLDVGDEKTKTITFNIPEYASDGGHSMEIRLSYGDEEIIEIEEITISRPQHFIKINSVAINPGVATCSERIFAFMNGENLGSSDETRIEVSAEIIGTNVFESTTILELDEDEKLQKSLTLPIAGLAAGTYTVEHTLKYSGITEVRDSTLIINECRDTAGIEIDNTGSLGEQDNDNNETVDNSSKVILFGNEVEKSTVYLGSGVGVIVLLIVISLFFL